MKVLMVLPNLTIGGAQRQTISLAKGLAGRGFEVALFAFEKKGAELTEEIPPEVGLYYPAFRAVSPIKMPMKIFSIWGAARKFKPELIYARLEHAPAAVAGKLRKIPVVISFVDDPKQQSVSLSALKRHISVFKRKLGVKLASQTTANSNSLAEECENFFKMKSKPRVIYNGLDLDLIRIKAREQKTASGLKDCSVPLCVSVGRLEKQKGFENLIEAFSILNKRMKARLLIIGEGKLRKSLTEKIQKLGSKNTVSLPGAEQNPYPFVSAADLYVQPSLHEGLSNTLIEALALGKPVVTTDHQFGANEIIEDGKNGLLVPVGNTEAIAEAIERILKDGNLRKNMSEKAKEKAKNFNLEKMISEYEKVFKEVLNQL